jgi:hypothetical protein
MIRIVAKLFTRIVIAAALALAVTLPAASAPALAARTFVSAAGSDNNNCASVATPCQHFQAAVSATALGGEVVALDPGKYGSFTISQAITIEGQGWAYIAPPNGGNGITINAVSGDVTIRGVSLNGNGTTGTNGIMFNSGGSLTVINCVLENFIANSNNILSVTGNGIIMEPATGTISFSITNTIVSNNAANGIYYIAPAGSTATVNGVIDHVVATNNVTGIQMFTGLGGGSTAVAISNSIASNNSSTGIYFANGSSALQGSIDNSTISGNTTDGIDAETASDLEIGRSVITYNGTGILNNTSPNRVFSYGDNRINSNAPNIGGSNGATLMSHALQ